MNNGYFWGIAGIKSLLLQIILDAWTHGTRIEHNKITAYAPLMLLWNILLFQKCPYYCQRVFFFIRTIFLLKF